MSRKKVIIRDMKTTRHKHIYPINKVLARIYGGGRGKIFTPKDFTDLASHDTVRQILSRLVQAGTIRRLLRGVYEYPAFSSLLNASAPPAPDDIARAIARTHGWTIFPTGETALNMLGLSTQVPARWEYFSDGPTKRYNWAGGTLILTHRANKETTILSPKTALVVQALKALGQNHIDDNAMNVLRRRWNAHEHARAVMEARYATSWVYEIMKQLAPDGDATHA